MAAAFRFAVAVGALSFLATSAISSPEMDAAFKLPGWAEPCSLPSVTASSSIVKDSAFRLASDDQPATADSAENDASGACSSECDSCGACDCCPCCATWSGYAGATILHRDQPDPGFIVVPQPGFFTIINAADFDFGWNGGLDVYLRRMCCCDGWDTRYFGDPGAEATIDLLVFPDEDFFIGGGAVTNVSNVHAGYNTDLHSFEINHRHVVNDWVTFLAGARYLNVEDNLTFLLTVPAGTGLYQWRESNDLIGAQLGTDFNLCDSGPWFLNSVCKAGVYGIAADNHYVNVTAGGATITDQGSTGSVAFVGEIDFYALYQISQNVAVHGGYQLLWIDGVALASDQAIRSSGGVLGTGIEADGSLFYNGVLVGIDFVW